MYNDFFGFKERPFKLVPNPAFLYLSRIHEEVLAHLNYAVGYGEGFVEVTGEVGTGKTTLCRKFLESLDKNTEAAYIFNPKLDALQLLKAINDEFGLASDTESIKTLIDRLNAFLLEKKTQGKQVILLVDEAQNLSADVLEQLRLLSNLETTTSKLLQIILVGQPELGALLETDALRQLNQRISLSCHLIPLSFSETREYIRHRIHIASRKPGLEFDPAAYRTIFTYTGGTPRLINIACDRALLTAYSLGQHRINNRIVKRAIRELDGKSSRHRSAPVVWQKLAIGLLAVLVIIVSGLFFGQTLFKRSSGTSIALDANNKLEQPILPTTLAIPAEAAKEPAPDDAKPKPLPVLQTPAAEALLALAPLPPALAIDVDPAPPPPVREFKEMMLSKDALTSRRGALTAALEAWHAPSPLGAEPMDGMASDTFFRISAQRSDMESLRIEGNLTRIKKLNLPAILEFPHPDGSGLRYMTAVGLTDDEIRLSDGEETIPVPLASIAERWNGVAYILWKNYFNYAGIIPISSSGEAVIALKVHLKALGYPIQEVSAAYNTATRLAVEAIQARNGLIVDGRVGPLTKIALYNEDKSLNIPRLAGTPHG